MDNWQVQAPCHKNDVTEAVVALGANLPVGERSPARTVLEAMQVLADTQGGTSAKSRLFQTPAFPPGAGPDFVNAAMRLSWQGSPASLLARLNEIEAEFGRTRQARWEARIVDLDLISFGDGIVPDAATQARWADLPPDEAARLTPDQLILPHPRLAERSFVLVPMADVAPDWVHPITGLSVAQMLAARPEAERAEITALPTPDDPAQPLSFAAPGDT